MYKVYKQYYDLVDEFYVATQEEAEHWAREFGAEWKKITPLLLGINSYAFAVVVENDYPRSVAKGSFRFDLVEKVYSNSHVIRWYFNNSHEEYCTENSRLMNANGLKKPYSMKLTLQSCTPTIYVLAENSDAALDYVNSLNLQEELDKYIQNSNYLRNNY